MMTFSQKVLSSSLGLPVMRSYFVSSNVAANLEIESDECHVSASTKQRMSPVACKLRL